MTDDVCTTALLRPSLLLAVGSCVLALRWALFVRARSFARSYLRLISVCLRSSSRSRVSPWFADRTTRLRRSTAASAPTTSRRRQCAATIASEVFTSRSTPIAPRSTCTARSLASSATAPTCKEPTLARGTTSPLPRTQYCTRHSSRSSCCYTRLSSTSTSSFVHLRPPSSDGTHPRLLFLLPPTRHSRSLP